MKNSPQNITKPRVIREGTLIPAIALALGSLSVVSGANPALATDSVKGVRDKAGVVEKSDQQTSDLPAGSCIIDSGEPSGNQAGFSWNTLEPSADSPDKKAWGLSVSFDNSKDRTFADWYFSNSANLNKVLDTGQVPSMEADQTFIDKDVTRKADEIIGISASGRELRNVNLYAELTDEKVKQFASASADNPVRYAWQSNYKKDNPYGPNATQGASATFGATVNPWPSENIECNPITVSWEDFEKHVIEPDTATKVGHINVPKLSNGETDDSMSRMVVEAYDSNGKYIGPASVDDNGDIYFTWPEYRNTDLETDKNVQFSVIAQPRTTEQLQTAVTYNNENGMVFDSSNSLERYSKANVIDSKSFSLDDTNYHDPKYKENEQHIVAEVGEVENNDTTRHVVTFTPVADSDGNTLQDLVDKFNATVELDEESSNIYEGWDAQLNDDHTVTVKSPGGKDTRPGTFAQPIIKVTYSNGSTDRIPLLVIVDPNNTQTTDVNYPKASSGGEAGKPMNVPPTLKRILGGGKPVAPATYEITETPEGWDVTVSNDGTITAIPPEDATPGDFANVEVKVTYPDGTIDTPSTTFVVGERKNKDVADPTFPEKTVYPGENATSTLTVEKPDDVGFAEENPFVIVSQDESFTATEETNEFGNPIYKVTTENGDWFVSLDDNGDVISKIPGTAQPGDSVNVPVKVAYADGSYDMANAPITVVDNARQVPFETVYVFDPEIPAGQYEVKEKGVPGREVLLRDETWSRVEDPSNEVVHIGTKPAESAKNVSWVVPIPFPTEVRENPDLKPGETRVVQEGENGENTYTAQFTAKGDEASVAEQETTKDPQPRIIEVGPGIENQDLTSTKTQEVPFDIEYVYDNTLESGEQIIEEEGIPGEESITSTQKIVDGKPSGEPSITIEQTKDPKNAKIRVGTKTTGESTETIESEIPFDVKVEFDPEMPAGTSETVTEGKPGKKTVTVKRDIVNSVAGEPNITETVVEKPVDQVIKVGTKPSESSETVKWTTQIPFEVETRPNPDLKPGEVKTIQEGIPGEKTYTANFTVKGDKATVIPEEKQTKEPVKEIIEYGPATDDTSVVTKVEKPVPFVTEIVFDDTLEKGKQVVDQQGQIGAEIVTSTQKIVDGKLSGDPEVVTERTKEPVKQIIRVGTFDPSPSVDMQQVSLPFGTKIIYDESLEPGQESIDQEGENGVVEVSVEDGQPSVKTVKEPVQRIVRVGTRPADGVEWSEEVPFGVQVIEDPDIEAGEHEVVQQGKPGEVVHKTDGTTVTRVEKVDHVIKVGTKSEGEHVSSYKKDVPFETEIVFDESLDAGVQETVQEGTLGKDKVTATLVIKNSKVVDTRVDTEHVSDPVKKIVKVGTKGTSASTTIEWVEETPFGVDVRVNPELQPGETRVVQEGTSGEVKHVVAVKVDGRDNVVKDDPVVSVMKDPMDQIIEVGPAKDYESVLSDKHTEKTPYETLIEYDPSLSAGKVVEDQAGVFGVVEVTKTWSLVNGVPVGEADESSRVVEKSKPRKLRVGSMCDCASSEVPESSEPAPVTSEEETPATSEPAPVTSEDETPVSSEKETPATSEPAPVTSEDETPVTSDEETPATSEPAPVTSDEETSATSDPTPVTSEDDTPVTNEPAPVTSDEETPATSEPAPVTSDEEETRHSETTPTTPGRNTEKKLTTVQPAGQTPQNTTVPETETETTETVSDTDDEQNDNVTKARNSALASTGANVVMILTIAGLIIIAGLGTMMMRRRDKDS